MRQAIVVSFLSTCWLAGGCSRPATQEAPEDPAGEAAQVCVGALVIGEPIQWKNLTFFPVASQTPKTDDRYLTLDEGLQAGTVQVSEVGAEPPQVPQQAEPAGAPRPAAIPAAPPQPAAKAPLPADGPRNVAGPTSPEILPTAPTAAKPGTEESILPPEKPTLPPASKPAEPETEDPFAPPPPETPQSADDQDGPDVNRLVVVNRSNKPLYLMPGEIIFGGEQDRAVADETIVQADGKPVTVNVYCVEAGRWESRDEGQTVAALQVLAASQKGSVDAQAAGKLAAKAKQGQFVAPAGSLTNAGRAAAQDAKGQQEVWDKVGAMNASTGVASQSDAFTANYTSPEMQKRLQEYVDKLQQPVAGQSQVVGTIVAINGKVQAVDVFQSTPLFQKLWPKLLRSHALDAAAASAEPAAGKTACTLHDAQAFLEAAMQANVAKTTPGQGGLVVTKRDSEAVSSFVISVIPVIGGGQGAAAGAGAGGGFGEGIHSAGFSKEPPANAAPANAPRGGLFSVRS